MSAPSPPRALYLADGRERIFSLFHEASAEAPRGLAVLMCPPFGWEDVCSYRSRREWAAQLASAGFPTLRIDLPSTADSAGSPAERGRLHAWTSSVAAAASWLEAECGDGGVAAIGVGLGGMLICAAIDDGAPIDHAVLWAVPSRGEALVREQRAFERIERARLGAHRDGQPAEEEGSLRAGGFTLSAETVAGLDPVDLAAAAYPSRRPRRVLLLERDGIGIDERLRERFEHSGARVRRATGGGYGAMMAEPQDSKSPLRVFALVEHWLAEEPPHAPARPRESGHAAAARAPVYASKVAELESGGAIVRETPVFIEQPFGRMFGILSEPGGGARGQALSREGQALSPQGAGVAALLLNAGAIRRVGPNRMWVEIARRWAAMGIATFRIDLEGLGDSDGDAARFADVGELYVPEFVSQVHAAIDFLEARGAARKVVLAGLCSGAYWSFHGALQDERVAAAFLLNPRTLFWDPAIANVRDVRRALLKPSSWRMIARGDVPLSRIGGVAMRAPRALVANTVAHWRERGKADPLEVALDELSAAGKQLEFLFSENEPLHDELKRQGRIERIALRPNLRVEQLPAADHTLRPARAQRGAHDALDRALRRTIEGVGV